MATGGLNIALAAAGEDTTKGNPTRPVEPWSATAGEKYKARVWEVLRHLFQQNELTDVMLVAEGQSVPCHRVLLAAASMFFYDKFVRHPESPDNNHLYIEGVDFDTLTAIVYFVKHGRIGLTLETTEKLIPASAKLMLPELTNMCKDFLLHKVEADIPACIDIYRIGKANSLTTITDRPFQVILRNFQEVSKINAFREMSESDLHDCIRDDRLSVANENPVFEAVVTWVRHDLAIRKYSFKRLMENVKLSYCSHYFLCEVVRKESLMESEGYLEHLSDAMSHHMTFPQQSGTARQGYYNTLIAVYDDTSSTLGMLEGGKSEWVRNTSSVRTKMLKNSSACMTRDGIVVTGGDNTSGYHRYSRRCRNLSIPAMKWTTLPDLIVARNRHTTVCVGSEVYVLGGWDQETALQSVEYLDEE